MTSTQEGMKLLKLHSSMGLLLIITVVDGLWWRGGGREHTGACERKLGWSRLMPNLYSWDEEADRNEGPRAEEGGGAVVVVDGGGDAFCFSEAAVNMGK